MFKEEDDYLNWKADILIRKMFTDTAAKKQGPAVILTLTGRVGKAACQLSAHDIGSDNSLKIINKSDTLFLQDKNTRAKLAFMTFYNYKRSSGENFSDFIIQFEKLYHRITAHDMKLPEAGKHTFYLMHLTYQRKIRN